MSTNHGLRGRFAQKKRVDWPEWIANGIALAVFAALAAYIMAGAIR